MRKRLCKQLADLVRDGDPANMEKVLFRKVIIPAGSRFSNHPSVVKQGGKAYMTNLCLTGLIMDGKPIAGVYEKGVLVGFK